MKVKFQDKINISLHESENLIHRSFESVILFNYSVFHINGPLSL
jgi:hypothetical protein